MDAILIANECLKTGILCKLDTQKAYDHLNWNFRIHMFQRMGFGTERLCGSNIASAY